MLAQKSPEIAAINRARGYIRLSGCRRFPALAQDPGKADPLPPRFARCQIDRLAIQALRFVERATRAQQACEQYHEGPERLSLRRARECCAQRRLRTLGVALVALRFGKIGGSEC